MIQGELLSSNLSQVDFGNISKTKNGKEYVSNLLTYIRAAFRQGILSPTE